MIWRFDMDNKKIEVLETAREYLDNLSQGIIQVGEMIQGGDEISASKRMVSVFEGIEYIIKVIELTNIKDKNLDEINNLNEQLEELIDAFENEDYILVGDLFQYELKPIVENMKDIFENEIKLYN